MRLNILNGVTESGKKRVKRDSAKITLGSAVLAGHELISCRSLYLGTWWHFIQSEEKIEQKRRLEDSKILKMWEEPWRNRRSSSNRTFEERLPTNLGDKVIERVHELLFSSRAIRIADWMFPLLNVKYLENRACETISTGEISHGGTAGFI